jgi:glutathione peroxidase
MNDLRTIPVTTIDGRCGPFGEHLGQLTLVVNVASKCGFTPQYEGLEALYRKYKGSGLQVLGFPCDQFGHQEPGNEEEIKRFCSLTYDVTFPLFAKVEVNGDDAHPLYQALKAAAPGIFGTERIKWNFTKFLIDAEGRVIARFAPNDTPEHLEKEIARLLPTPAPLATAAVTSSPPPPAA